MTVRPILKQINQSFRKELCDFALAGRLHGSYTLIFAKNFWFIHLDKSLKCRIFASI